MRRGVHLAASRRRARAPWWSTARWAASACRTEPVELTSRGQGNLVSASGTAGAALLEILRGAGEGGTDVAELGIGTNECATLTGNLIEDEKILGTCHVAFGASAGIGGEIQVPIHEDFVVMKPTVEADGEALIAGASLLRS